MSTKGMTQAEKQELAKRKLAEMKAAAEAKRAAKAAAGVVPAPAAANRTDDEVFILGDHRVILVDWDDTMFPTSEWGRRCDPNSTRPLRSSKVAALSEAISAFITALQRIGDVKIVTHATKGWFEMSSAALLPETRQLLDALPKRYRDSYGAKYTTKKPSGQKYTTTIGSEVKDYGEWYKTDMFFEFIAERVLPRKWDETHLPAKVAVPQQVLIIGDGSAEKKSYHELGNQAQLYASRPGHKAVGQIGLKGVFYKEGPSFEELLVQMRWATESVEREILPPGDAQTKLWDLTGFPEWSCCEKVGPGQYTPLCQGSLLAGATRPGGGGGQGAGAAAGAAESRGPAPRGPAPEYDEEAELQMAIAASLQAS